MAFEVESAVMGLVGAVVGGGISSLTAWLIARNERKKYQRERSWDLRREAYTKIIGALDRARAITRHIDDEYDIDPHTWDASDSGRRANEQMIEHFHVARIAFHANRLMLSKAFVAKYDEMNRSLGEGNNQNLLPPESSKITAVTMQRIVPEMEALAIRELGVD